VPLDSEAASLPGTPAAVVIGRESDHIYLMDQKHDGVAPSGTVLSGSERLEARRKAEERLAVIKGQNAKALEDYTKLRQIEAAKTARLRALRLAKEAADKEASDNAPAAAPPAPKASPTALAAPKRPRRSKSPKPATPDAANPTSASSQREQGGT
jgi:hypothetical protein